MNAAGERREDEVSKRNTRSPIKSRMKTILGLGGRNLHRMPHIVFFVSLYVWMGMDDLHLVSFFYLLEWDNPKNSRERRETFSQLLPP